MLDQMIEQNGAKIGQSIEQALTKIKGYTFSNQIDLLDKESIKFEIVALAEKLLGTLNEAFSCEFLSDKQDNDSLLDRLGKRQLQFDFNMIHHLLRDLSVAFAFLKMNDP